jgi:hypothetical protein
MSTLPDLSSRFLGDEPKFIPAENWYSVQRQLDWCLGFFAAYFAAVDPEEYYGDRRPKRTELLQKVQAFERTLLAIKCCTLCGGSGEERFSYAPGNEGAYVIKVAPGLTFPKLVGTCPKCYGTGLEDA